MTSPTTRTYVNCSAISSTNKASRTTTSSTGTCSKSYVLSPLGIMYSGWPVLWKTWKCQGICQLSGKCQVFYEVWEMSGGGILSGKSGLKLFIVSCIFVSIQVFSTSTGMIWVPAECHKLSGKCQGIFLGYWWTLQVHRYSSVALRDGFGLEEDIVSVLWRIRLGWCGHF